MRSSTTRKNGRFDKVSSFERYAARPPPKGVTLEKGLSQFNGVSLQVIEPVAVVTEGSVIKLNLTVVSLIISTSLKSPLYSD